MGEMVPTDFITAAGVVVVVILAVIANARSQAAVRQIVEHTTEKLKKHSESLDRSKVDLLRTTIRSEKNEEAISQMRETLLEVRDMVVEIRAEMKARTKK